MKNKQIIRAAQQFATKRGCTLVEALASVVNTKPLKNSSPIKGKKLQRIESKLKGG